MTSNYLRASLRNILRRNWIFLVAEVVTVPSDAVLKSFIIYRSSSDFPFSNIWTFSSYVSDVADAGYQRILILMMLNSSTFYADDLIRGNCGGSIRA